MKRRAFLASMTGSEQSGEETLVLSNLTPMTGNLDRQQTYHLIRRLNFAPTPELVDTITGMTADTAVDLLLGTGKEPLPPRSDDDWANKMEENPLTVGTNQVRFAIEGRLKSRYGDFCNWWLELMRTDSLPSREKLTLFWSTVWCINFDYDTLALIPTPLLYFNNQTLRNYSSGNHPDFVENVTLDGAMLLYQSLQYSSAVNGQRPNENYMRELLELFTMGIGYYTEADIKEGAKALTGWRTACYIGTPHSVDAPFKSYFDSSNGVHDIGAKDLMGETIPARTIDDNTEDQVRRDEVRGIIDILYQRRPEAIADFICSKIYHYFVYSNTFDDSLTGRNNSEVISSMAEAFIDNNFEIRPVLKALFTSEHFFDEANYGIQLKPPPEFIVGLETQLGVQYPGAKEAVFAMDQELYNPPNVGSWEAYRTWISTTTYPLRIKFAREILEIATDQHLITLAKKFDNYSDASGIVNSLEEYFLPNPVGAERHSYYLNALLSGAGIDETGWTTASDAVAANGIRDLISAFIKAPDFQLS
ncbi:DUF1800 family protein [Bacteroidota bacterium]